MSRWIRTLDSLNLQVARNYATAASVNALALGLYALATYL